MSAIAKYTLLVLKNPNVRKAIIGSTVGVLLFFIILIGSVFFVQQNSSSSEAARIAIEEYEYWQSHTPAQAGYSCQGEKYCSYYQYDVVDWCCFFAGYCYAQAGVSDSGYASATNAWTSNLEAMDKLHTASSGYIPKIGNAVFFNYSGRANYAATNFVAHVGIVIDINGDTITVIAGNEYNGATVSEK